MAKFDSSNFNFFGNSSFLREVKLGDGQSGLDKKKSQHRRQGRQCRIEELENREMLSVTPWVLVNNYSDLADTLALETPEYRLSGLKEVTLQPLGAATPAGFNDNDFQKLFVAGLVDETGSTLKGKITWNDEASKCLVSLDVSRAELIGSLDLSGCEALKELDVSRNQLTKLDVSSCTALTSLWCFNNQLKELDVSNDTALTFLSCSSNQLKELDVLTNTALAVLLCSENQLKKLDVSNNTALADLYCPSNQLTELDVTKNLALESLYCGENDLTKLDVSKNTDLTNMSCSNNKLTELDVSKNTALTDLRCFSNQLTKLDVSNNTALTWLSLFDNRLTFSKILLPPKPLSSYKYLDYFNQANMKISLVSEVVVDLSSEYLDGKTTFTWYVNNKVSTAYTNENGVFTFTEVDEGDVLYCVMTNVNFPELIFEFYGSPIFSPELQLRTVSVTVGKITLPYNDHDWNTVASQGLNKYAQWGKVNSELRLIELYIPPDSISGSLNLSGCTALEKLSCVSNQLTELNMSGLTALRQLDCSQNQLKELVLSGLTMLEKLSCSSNQLKELDVSCLMTLQLLDCSWNPLTELNASGLTALISVSCDGDILYRNTLVSLNLSGCTALETVYSQHGSLTMLDITGCEALKFVECCDNRLTFSTLPPPGAFEYYYAYTSYGYLAGQAKVAIRIDKDDSVDLSGEYMEGSTTYTWKYADGKVVDSSLYSEVDGVFTFTGLNATDVIYCEMTNANFPDLTLVTTRVVFGMGDITYNAHDWNLVASQNLQAYATWGMVDGEAYLIKIEAGGTYMAKGPLADPIDMNLSGCEYLTEVQVAYNQLTALDVSGCTSLKILMCSNNQLTELNVSGCTALETLAFGRNPLTNVDVTGLTKLELLSCANTQITSLDVSGFTALDYLYCVNSQLTYLNVSGCTALMTLNCVSNALTFSTLPLPGDLLNGCDYNYTWGWNETGEANVGQALVPIVAQGSTVDLSSEYLGGKTSFVWYLNSSTKALVAGTDYTASEGVFVFKNLATGDQVHCVMTNSNFTGLTLTTTKATITVVTPLAQPVLTDVVATGSDKIRVEWDADANANSYTIEWSTDSTFATDVDSITALSPATSAEITGLDGNTLYYVRIMAIGKGAFSDSNWSDPLSATTEKNKLAKPTLGNVLSSGMDVIDIEWSTIENADGYTIEWATDSTFAIITGTEDVDSATLLLTIDKLDTKTTYYVRVMATSSGDYGDSDWSDTKSAKTGTTKLTAPTLGSVTATSSSEISVEWSADANADDYVVEYKNASDSNWTSANVTIDGTTATISNLSANTAYNVRVMATGSGEYSDSDWSTGSTTTEPAIINPVTPLDAPKDIVLAVTGSDTITVSWTAVANADCYVVEYRKAGDLIWSSANVTFDGTTATITNLAPNTLYHVRVIATGSGDYSDSDWSTDSAIIELDRPIIAAITKIPETMKINLSWEGVLADWVTGYEIAYSVDGGKTWALIFSNSLLESTEIPNLAGADYQFRVRAVELKEGKITAASAWSEPVVETLTKLDDTTAARPKKVAVVKNATTISTVTLNVTGIAGGTASFNVIGTYKVGKATLFAEFSCTVSEIGNDGKATIKIVGLRAGTKYTFYVQAVNGAGNVAGDITNLKDKNLRKVNAATAKYVPQEIRRVASVKPALGLNSVTLAVTGNTKFTDLTRLDLTATGYKMVITFTNTEKNAAGRNTKVIYSAILETGIDGTGVGTFASTNPAGKYNGSAFNVTKNGTTFVFTNLPQAGTRYSFAVQTIASGFYGSVESTIAKASATTLKFTAPSKSRYVLPKADGTLSLQWNVNLKLDVYKNYVAETNETVKFYVHLSDSKGNLTNPAADGSSWIEITNVAVLGTRGVFTGEYIPTGFNLAAGAVNNYVIKAVTTAKNLDGGAGIESLTARAKFSIPR